MIWENGVPVTIRKQGSYRDYDPAPEAVQRSTPVSVECRKSKPKYLAPRVVQHSTLGNSINGQSVTSQLQTAMLASEYQQLVFRQQIDEMRRQAETQRLEHERRMLELQVEIARLEHDIRNAKSRTAIEERKPRHQELEAHYNPRSRSHEVNKLKAGYDFKNQKASAEASGDLAWFLTAGLLAIAGSVAYSRK